ncbi:hypothetical protein CROQUDRAFT_98502 [Cronartium quercuum f. sp. fusiforme G11]|uniref:Endonuclease/exonuclease/phosphatase domain-containing protein n=1 Tax=Cronartium quercuum f. sp. fusiforme G11 TaxID=708437 RepID=A0A9P6NCV3_9BASI|nr:hypothetical protein CROQUDRAFT_98502 [Cronartium quercuum f. sp. fusiforme G11]
MDADLHHQAWSTSTTCCFNPQAKFLNHLCGSASFRLISPKGIPTRYSKGSSPTVIDLIWANWKLTKFSQRCDVLSENFGSDHQAIVSTFDLSLIPQPMFHNNTSLRKLNHDVFREHIQMNIKKANLQYDSPQDIETTANKISQIMDAYYAQGRNTQTQLNCHKSQDPGNRDSLLDYQEMPTYEILTILENLPSKKVPGPDKIPNELIKIAGQVIVGTITKLFNACLRLGLFPQPWKVATTAIIRKAGKDDYSEPGAY